MAKFDLDIKKFKHVKSDDKTTTLRHKDGHEITLAHKALSKDIQKQLSALAPKDVKMADGGNVPTGWDNYRAPKPVDPNTYVEKPVTHKRSPEAQEQHENEVRAQSDASTENFRKQNPAPAEPKEEGYQNYADGGDVLADPRQVRSENPNYQPPFESLKGEEPAPEQSVNPYAEIYNKTYAQQTKLNPGQPADISRQSALNMVELQKNADQSNAKIAVEDAQAQQTKIMQENQRRQAIGLEPIPVPSVPQMPGSNQPVQMPQTAATAEPIKQAQTGIQNAQQGLASGLPGSMNREPESMLESGYQNKIAGINQEATAVGQLGQHQAELLDKGVQAQQQAKDSYLETYRKLDEERQNLTHDIQNGFIDPDQYWKGRKNPETGEMEGGHSKIAAGIGMILAGFNPSNSPNAAVNFLKYQMDNNLEAQRQNLAAKNNLLAHNLQQFGNLRDAMTATRLAQNEIVVNQLQSAAAKAQSPMAKAAAMKAIGQIQMESAPLFQQFALRRSMMNLASNGGSPQAVEHMLGYMRVVNPEMAKEMSSRYVPGVGLAATAVPDKVRGDIIAKQTLTSALQDLQQWAGKHSGSLSPTAIIEGRTKAANVQNLYRDAINGGVYKEGEQKFLSGIVDSEPTKFFNNIRVIPKLNEVIRENQASLNILKKGYGLPVQQEPAQPQIKIVNGVKYMRGPNGQAIRVK